MFWQLQSPSTVSFEYCRTNITHWNSVERWPWDFFIIILFCPSNSPILPKIQFQDTLLATYLHGILYFEIISGIVQNPNILAYYIFRLHILPNDCSSELGHIASN